MRRCSTILPTAVQTTCVSYLKLPFCLHCTLLAAAVGRMSSILGRLLPCLAGCRCQGFSWTHTAPGCLHTKTVRNTAQPWLQHAHHPDQHIVQVKGVGYSTAVYVVGEPPAGAALQFGKYCSWHGTTVLDLAIGSWHAPPGQLLYPMHNQIHLFLKKGSLNQ